MTWALNKRLDWQINQPVRDQIFGRMQSGVISAATRNTRDPVGLSVNQQLFHPVRAQLEQDIGAVLYG